MKTFEQFDLSFQPSIDERQIRELRTLRLIHDVSCDSARRLAVVKRISTAHELVDDLGRADHKGRRDRRMKVYLAP